MSLAQGVSLREYLVKAERMISEVEAADKLADPESRYPQWRPEEALVRALAYATVGLLKARIDGG